jgi:hypothetical protein
MLLHRLQRLTAHVARAGSVVHYYRVMLELCTSLTQERADDVSLCPDEQQEGLRRQTEDWREGLLAAAPAVRPVPSQLLHRCSLLIRTSPQRLESSAG